MRSSRPAPAFTLIELLVVISIISLLVSILLPALAKSRQASQRTQCGSNLRQNLVGFHSYTGDYQGNLPDAGYTAATTNAGGLENHMMGFGGYSGGVHRYPRGVGALFYGGYLTSLLGAYCPSESGGYNESLSKRITDLGYKNAATFKAALDAANLSAWGSYVVRINRWKIDGGITTAALDTGLTGGGQYLSNIDKPPLSRFSAAAILADTFEQVPNNFPVNWIEYYHREGLNVGFADGHVQYKADTGGYIRLLRTNVPTTTIYIHNYQSEAVWWAIDGGRGRANYASTYWPVAGLVALD